MERTKETRDFVVNSAMHLLETAGHWRVETAVTDPATGEPVKLIIRGSIFSGLIATTRDDSMCVDLRTQQMYSKGLSSTGKRLVSVDDTRFNRLAGLIVQASLAPKS